MSYPYHVAPDGDDANPGTPDKPLRTGKSAFDRTCPGEPVTIRYAPGRYVEHWTMPEIAAGQGITVEGIGPGVRLTVKGWNWWNHHDRPAIAGSLRLSDLVIEDTPIHVRQALRCLEARRCRFVASPVAVLPSNPGVATATFRECSFQGNGRASHFRQYQILARCALRLESCRLHGFQVTRTTSLANSAAVIASGPLFAERILTDNHDGDAFLTFARVKMRGVAGLLSTLGRFYEGPADIDDVILLDPPEPVAASTHGTIAYPFLIACPRHFEATRRHDHKERPDLIKRRVTTETMRETYRRQAVRLEHRIDHHADPRGPKPCDFLDQLNAAYARITGSSPPSSPSS